MASTSAPRQFQADNEQEHSADSSRERPSFKGRSVRPALVYQANDKGEHDSENNLAGSSVSDISNKRSSPKQHSIPLDLRKARGANRRLKSDKVVEQLAEEGTAADAHVTVSLSHKRAEYEHQLQLRDINMRRLQKLQCQRAYFGIAADPAIEMQIEDIEHSIAQIDKEIELYYVASTMRADRALILSVEQQRAAVLALSRITGLPSDKIKVIDIVLGSIVLIVDMPLAGAARLVAMQRLNHPMLREQGFANVTLDAVVGAQDQPIDKMFERAVRFAQAELTDHSLPSNESSPYANLDTEARVRITLTENAAQRK